MQVGQAAGTLAHEVFGTTDIGLPLLDRPAPALVAANVDAFAEGLDAPAEEVRLFLALREAAPRRLFTHVAVAARRTCSATVEAYARGITIDADQLEEAVRSIDLTDTAALQQALSGGVFAPHTTPAQKAALERLETALALVEGWVDEVTAAAALPHLPHTVALREMIRRRRAAGGPAEQTFANLVGLELRPRRPRDAAALWAQITRDNGASRARRRLGPPRPAARHRGPRRPGRLRGPPRGRRRRAADVDRALAEIFGEDPDAEPDGLTAAGAAHGAASARVRAPGRRSSAAGPSASSSAGSSARRRPRLVGRRPPARRPPSSTASSADRVVRRRRRRRRAPRSRGVARTPRGTRAPASVRG